MKKVLIILATIVALTLVSCSENPIKLVSFDTGDGTKEATQFVYVDNYAKRPTKNPILADNAFVNWYADPGFKEVFDFDNTKIVDDTVIYADYDQAFVTFSSTDSFNMKITGDWKGKIFYSLDGANWEEYHLETNVEKGYEATGAITATDEVVTDSYRILFRGLGNTVITGAAGNSWSIDAKKAVYCTGDIRTLLDYEKVKANKTITVGASAFEGMFSGWTCLASIPTISNIPLYGANAFKNMFSCCTGLSVSTSAVEGAQTFTCINANPENFCAGMFYGVSSLTTQTTYYITEKATD